MTINKKEKLLKDNRNLYHVQDLSVLWQIENKNTLWTTIKRYVQSGFLHRIHKGFYSARPIKEIDPVELGLASLRRWGYLSVESVLVNKGIIFQDLNYITLISDVSKKFSIGQYNYKVRKMKTDFLYNEIGIKDKKASPERAVADMIYYNRNYYFDNRKKIDWDKVRDIKNKIGYNYDINS